MQFASYSFLLVFLPASLLGYFLLAKRVSPRAGIAWLTVASFVFYGLWHIGYAVLLAASILWNFLFGRWILQQRDHVLLRKRLLVLGLVGNVGLLAYFKYWHFFTNAAGEIFGADWVVGSVLLPLGISFLTFQQIAYLVDCARGTARTYGLLDFAFSTAFFPKLISGPITYHRELIPQIRGAVRDGLQAATVGPAATLFFIGLFKKVVIADSFAAPVAHYTSLVAEGGIITFFVAWPVALAFAVQLYFDFSGYTDMAMGVARLFGFRLPQNFNAPYRATGIQDFWRRWHMTLSRFLRDYVYIPLGGNRRGNARTSLNILLTFLIGGLWHGAGWTYLAWGGVHGLLLNLQRWWRRLFPDRIRGWVNRLLTFLAVTLAWVPFSAPSLQVAGSLYASLFGFHGLGSTTILLPLLIPGLAIVWLFPSSMELLTNARPALDQRAERPSDAHELFPLRLRWSPSTAWAVVIAGLGITGVLYLTRVQEFLYAGF